MTVSQEGDDVDNNNNNSMEDRKLTIVDHKEEEVEEVPILLLNGFGVGSFHQHRLMRQLLLRHAEYEQQQYQHQHSPQQHKLVIYGIDYLGQGNSWPATCNGDGTSRDELNLGYSADVWLDQLKDFIDEVVLVSPSSSSLSNNDITMAPSSSSCRSNNKKVHLVGNSVGGYLATILTSRHPHYIASLILLNATPVWGLNLPGWDGRLPPPPLPKYVGGQLFDIIRNPNVINMYLQTAYVHPEAYDGTYEDCFYGADDGLKQQEDSTTRSRKDSGDASLGVKIRACTEGKGGHVAFASILWSAPASEWEDKKETKKTSTTKEVNDDDESKFATPIRPVDFYSTLQNLPVDVLLLFGANDPWCTPAIAKRMHTTLSKRNDDGGDNRVTTANGDCRHVRIVSLVQRYVSLDNVGHCPNHEAPTAVAKVVLPWIRAGAFSSSSSQDQQQQNRYNVPLVVHDGSEVTREPWGVVRADEVSLDESRDLGVIDRIVSSIVG